MLKPRRRPSRARLLLWWRYSASSVVAGVISELVFLASYGAGAAPRVASVVAFVAGAVPNYVLNRRWAWRQRGRVHGTRELLPYLVIIVLTAVAAAAITTAADHWLRGQVDSHLWLTVLVSMAFIGTYGVMFVLKFVLFDRYVFVRRSGDVPATKSRA